MSTPERHLALGIDVGTSTCQAYLFDGVIASPLELQADVLTPFIYTAVLERSGKARLFAMPAILEYGRHPEGSLYEAFKPLMRSDPKLPRNGVTAAKAADLFTAMATDVVRQVTYRVRELAQGFAHVRLDVSFTVPGGWTLDVPLKSRYTQIVNALETAVKAEFQGMKFEIYGIKRDTKVDIEVGLVEEPVAALLGIDGQLGAMPEGEAVLVVDAGGGTLDLAVCRAVGQGGERRYEVGYVDSIGVAGEAVLRAFVRTLEEQDAFTPPLPMTWWSDPNLRRALREDVFWRYYMRPGREFVCEVSDSVGRRHQVRFSVDAADAALANTAELQEIHSLLDGALRKYGNQTGDQRRRFHAVAMVGGLTNLPAFRATVHKVYPRARAVPEPERQIAAGAARYAHAGGTLVAGRPAPHILAEQLFQGSSSDVLVWRKILDKGTLIVSGEEFGTPTVCAIRTPGTSFCGTLGWTHGERHPHDLVAEIFSRSVEPRTPGGEKVFMPKGAPLTLELRFDRKLRLLARYTHRDAVWLSEPIDLGGL